MNESSTGFRGLKSRLFLLSALPFLLFMAIAWVSMTSTEALTQQVKNAPEIVAFQSQILWWVGGGAVLSTLVFIYSLYSSIRLSSRLDEITRRMSHSGEEVAAASGQLSSSSHQLSNGATQAASSLQETVAAIEELSSMVKLNADHSREAAALSQSSRKAAEEGDSSIHQLIEAMNGISESSKKIEEIIDVIEDIAFQTNILALNAAVEAARAGEQGKGFAVVAEAVRNLAQRSGEAAKEISGLIKDSVGKVEGGSATADKSGLVFQTIVKSIQKISELNNEIASASQEQSSGLAQISHAMNQLDQTTQGNAGSAQEVASSSQAMSSQASALQGLVADLAGIVRGHASSSVTSPTAAFKAHRSREMSFSNAQTDDSVGDDKVARPQSVQGNEQPRAKSKAHRTNKSNLLSFKERKSQLRTVGSGHGGPSLSMKVPAAQPAAPAKITRQEADSIFPMESESQKAVGEE